MTFPGNIFWIYYEYTYISHQFLIFKSINHQKLFFFSWSFDWIIVSINDLVQILSHHLRHFIELLEVEGISIDKGRQGDGGQIAWKKAAPQKKHHQNRMKPKKHSQKWNEHLRDYPNLLMRKLTCWQNSHNLNLRHRSKKENNHKCQQDAHGNFIRRGVLDDLCTQIGAMDSTSSKLHTLLLQIDFRTFPGPLNFSLKWYSPASKALGGNHTPM